MESPGHRAAPDTSNLPIGFGALLRECRSARGLSQLALALSAGVSARHLSYVETGKAQPSREMVSRLADTLKMPLREHNVLLLAAGYAPRFPETALSTPRLSQVRHAVDYLLAKQEPFPAFVINRRWDVLLANAAADRVAKFLGLKGHSNMIRQLFDPTDIRQYVVNWEEIAGDLIGHLHGAIASSASDTEARSLLDEVLQYPGVPERWRTRDLGAEPPPLLTTVFRKNGQELRFFSTITTFGTSGDVTVDELRIKCNFPGDDATADLCRDLARQAENPMPV
ncbi:MAG: helix-turn-helix transcriptional regulator [Gemmatimonadota bacterium]